MKKITKLFIITIVILAFILTGCANNNDQSTGFEYNSPEMEQTDDSENLEDINNTIAERKIIYNVSATINTDNLDETINSIKNNLAADEWPDEESISNGYARLVLRIKSDRLDEFIKAISEKAEISDFTKTATDVSLDYQDTSNRIESLETERNRLTELYENASISDMIEINSRISEIDLEIGNLQGTLNQYDSLIDYSKVTLVIYENPVETKLSFGKRISNMFKNAWKALVTFFEWIFLALVAIFPFAIIIVPVGVGIFFLVKFIKKKKSIKKLEKEKTNTNNDDLDKKE